MCDDGVVQSPSSMAAGTSSATGLCASAGAASAVASAITAECDAAADAQYVPCVRAYGCGIATLAHTGTVL